MNKNRIESKTTHITCDNSNCDYEDVEVTIENVEEYLNLECPNCGDILLTESDLNTFRVMKSTVNLINGMDDKTFDALIDSYGGENSDEENDEERISVKVTSHEDIKFEIINGEKNKEEMDNLEWRMYGLVPYNISDIQKGIQFGHGVVEYGLEHSDHVGYEKWSQKDKTFIILNGGTTNKDIDNLGTLNLKLIDLYAMGVKCSVFTEPDLGNQLTAITFLLDERVWDIEKYPSPPNVRNPIGTIQPDVSSYIENMGGEYVYNIRKFIFNHKLA